MKFLHLADLHIGKQVAGFPMISDQRVALRNIVDMAERNKVDAVVLAGDIYDKSSPSEDAVRVFDWFLFELSQLQVPCIGIPGNHDSADRLAFAQRLLARQGVHLPAVFDGKVSCVQLEDAYGLVTFWMMPFLRPSDVRRVFPNAEADGGESKTASHYTSALRMVLDACPVDTDQRNVVVSHQFVTSGGLSPERASEELNLGGLDNVDVSVYDAFDYVALGHVHRPQRIGRDTARYAGSLLKYSFSEVRYGKSAVLVELGPKNPGDGAGDCVSFELLPIAPVHEMREIKGPFDELVSPEVAAAGNTQDYLHVILTDELPQVDALARLRAVYPNVMQLDYEARDKQRQDVPERTFDAESIDAKSLFCDFFLQQTGRGLTEEQKRHVEKALLATGFDEADGEFLEGGRK